MFLVGTGKASLLPAAIRMIGASITGYDGAVLKLEWLEAFAVFADHLSFTRAAKALHVSQPALHAQIQKLGEALGVPLYTKDGQRLSLTAEGQRAAAFGRELRGKTRELVDEVKSGGRSAEVVMAAGEGAYLYLLGPGIRAFLREGSGRLRLLTKDREGALESVRSGEAQVGVAALDEIPEALSASPLAEVGQALAVPEGHPLAARSAVKLTDLEGARLVVPPADRPHRVLLGSALRRASVSWEVAVEASGWELMLRFVEMGVGLAVVNAFCAPPPSVVLVAIPELPRLSYQLVFRKDAPRSRALEGLVTALRAGLPAPSASR